MDDLILYCANCWRVRLRKAPVKPCKCGSLEVTAQVDAEKRDRAMAARWRRDIASLTDHKFLEALKISPDEPKEPQCKPNRSS